jgi:hypothetical protein
MNEIALMTKAIAADVGGHSDLCLIIGSLGELNH